MRELAAAGVVVRFQGVVALGGVDLRVAAGEILGLIGPNGAGKTTVINCLTGFQAPASGSIVLDGTDITGWPPERMVCHTASVPGRPPGAIHSIHSGPACLPGRRRGERSLPAQLGTLPPGVNALATGTFWSGDIRMRNVARRAG
jgi:energy-coupling factor transporter ATP-binding protein EcfA2